MGAPANDTDDSQSAERRRTTSPAPTEGSARSFVVAGLAVELALGVLGWGLGVWRGVVGPQMLRITTGDLVLGGVAGLGLVALHFSLVVPGGAQNPLHRTVYGPLYEVLAPALRKVWGIEIVLLALASGIGEEMLFRGWLQTETNLAVASVVFGGCHVWGRDGLAYGLYATAMGFVLGGLFMYTDEVLWTPMVAHAVNNLIGFLALKYDWLPPPDS